MQRLKKTGYTFVELLVAMGIGMVVLAAVATTFMSQTRFYNAQEQINEMQQNARSTLNLITRELKVAGYKLNTGPVAGLTAFGVNFDLANLVIEADIIDPPDNVIDGSAGSRERITYAYNANAKQITRRLGSGTADVCADNITAFNFTYLQADGVTAATQASQIRQVKIDITAQTAKPDPNYTFNGGYRTYQVTATITPPNLAY